VIELAQRYPDLRYCVDDRVLFLIGYTRTLPLDQFLITDQPAAAVAVLWSGVSALVQHEDTTPVHMLCIDTRPACTTGRRNYGELTH
jgi:hypothetical protein